MNDDALDEREMDEELEDLGHVDNWSAGAVLWSTDWTAETIISQLNRGNIDLNPSFQRRSAWTDKKQSLFVESLVLGLPIPQLVLGENKNRKGAFIVIDGKQRLLAIRRFASEEKNDSFKPLVLKNLTERQSLNGKTYIDLLANDENEEDISAFQNSSIRTVVIRNWRNESYLYEVFLRINTGSVQLSPQELRQALHPGPFSTYVDKASAESQELKQALNLKNPDFRMRDAEIVLRYLAYKNFSASYNGNLKIFLDNTTKDINKTWERDEERIKDQVKEMEIGFEFTRELFGERNYLRKWNGVEGEFESRKNRAIFDIMLHFFSVPETRTAVKGKGNLFVEKFKDLCAKDVEFLASLERTTKSLEANKVRFGRWAEVIEGISGIQVQTPAFGS